MSEGSPQGSPADARAQRARQRGEARATLHALGPDSGDEEESLTHTTPQSQQLQGSPRQQWNIRHAEEAVASYRLPGAAIGRGGMMHGLSASPPMQGFGSRMAQSSSSPAQGLDAGQHPQPPPLPRQRQQQEIWAQGVLESAGLRAVRQAQERALHADPHSERMRPQSLRQPSEAFHMPYGSEEARAALADVVQLATEAIDAAGMWCVGGEQGAQAYFNSVFTGHTLRMWTATREAHSSTSYAGMGSRIYCRLRELFIQFTPHDAYGEWKAALLKFRWLGTLSATQIALDQFSASWDALAAATQDLPLPKRVPQRSVEWLWHVLMSSSAGPPAWAVEAARLHPDQFDVNIFTALRAHVPAAGTPLPRPAQGGGRPLAAPPTRIHALDRVAEDTQLPRDRVAAVMASWMGEAAGEGLGMRADSTQDGAWWGGSEGGGLAALSADGTVVASNGRPIQCFLCGENHFQRDCPKAKSAGQAPSRSSIAAPRSAPSSAAYVRQGANSFVTGVKALSSGPPAAGSNEHLIERLQLLRQINEEEAINRAGQASSPPPLAPAVDAPALHALQAGEHEGGALLQQLAGPHAGQWAAWAHAGAAAGGGGAALQEVGGWAAPPAWESENE